MLLIDEQGTIIQGFIPSGRVKIYLPDMKQGSVYLYDVVGHMKLVNGQTLIERPILNEAEIATMRHLLGFGLACLARPHQFDGQTYEFVFTHDLAIFRQTSTTAEDGEGFVFLLKLELSYKRCLKGAETTLFGSIYKEGYRHMESGEPRREIGNMMKSGECCSTDALRFERLGECKTRF
ncbi:hypothetical protein HID58_054521 [Brassica napus]|uniref:Uncharacterized protein n=1 Tax=Brassica napus TaxID=3708 RepID=A0ABQ8AHU9_BRANA|nr:hypothetical protein HID58_054521 [Brassica napus]